MKEILVNRLFKERIKAEMAKARNALAKKGGTTEAVNALSEKVRLRMCSNPTKAAEDIYERLKYKKMPFRRRIKVCSTQ